LFGIIPTYVDRRLLAAPPHVSTCSAQIAGPIGDAFVPLIERHLELGNGEAFRDDDLVLRAFMLIGGLIIWWRAHHEFARPNDDHFGAVAALTKLVHGL
jgi:hypothetical protein